MKNFIDISFISIIGISDLSSIYRLSGNLDIQFHRIGIIAGKIRAKE